jgi:hypothetical protein
MQRLIYFLSVGEESGINLDMDISDRDTLFREAEIIVNAQQVLLRCYNVN